MSATPPQTPTPLSKETFWQAVTLSGLSGVVIVVIPYLLTMMSVSFQRSNWDAMLTDPRGQLFVQYSFSLMALLPFVQGIAAAWKTTGYRIGFWQLLGLLSIVFVGDMVAAVVLFQEGSVCLLISFPFFYLIMLIGMRLGEFIFKRRRKARLEAQLLVPLIMLLVAVDSHEPVPPYADAVSDAVTIQAPPEVVWRYIVQYPENTDTPDYWLWRLGLPNPIQSVAESAQVGAKRACKFTDGVTFGEEITEVVPNKVMTFKVTEQPQHPEAMGHFTFDKGQMFLEANPDGSTTIIATSWYRLLVRPAFYYNWWMTDIVRHVHFRVLGHIKELAEKDQAARS